MESSSAGFAALQRSISLWWAKIKQAATGVYDGFILTLETPTVKRIIAEEDRLAQVLICQRDCAEDYVIGIRENLQKIEWSGPYFYRNRTCPACGGIEDGSMIQSFDPSIVGHKADCWLAAAIREAGQPNG